MHCECLIVAGPVLAEAGETEGKKAVDWSCGQGLTRQGLEAGREEVAWAVLKRMRTEQGADLCAVQSFAGDGRWIQVRVNREDWS